MTADSVIASEVKQSLDCFVTLFLATKSNWKSQLFGSLQREKQMSKVATPASVPSKIRERLYEKLKDPAYAAAYLNEALLEGDEIVFKTAMADVIRARGVVSVAAKAGINRVTIFKTLKPETRTSFVTYHALLKACGIDFGTRAISNRVKSAKIGDRQTMSSDLLGQRVGKTRPQSS